MTTVERSERVLARITSADIAEVYNGMLGLAVTFEYESGGGQALNGYILDASMVIRFMRAINVMKLSKAVGVSCWVTHTHCEVLRIEPLHAKDGVPFDIKEWQAWMKERIAPLGICYREMETGERVNRGDAMTDDMTAGTRAALDVMEISGFTGKRGAVVASVGDGPHTLRAVEYHFPCGHVGLYVEAEEDPYHSDAVVRIHELATVVHLLQNVGYEEAFQIGNRERDQ